MRVVVKVALQDPLDPRFLPKIHQLHTAEPGRGGRRPRPWSGRGYQLSNVGPGPGDTMETIYQRERRDASSELLSLDLISVPAIPGNSAQGHWVSRCSCFRPLTPDDNLLLCWPRVSPAAHSGL